MESNLELLKAIQELSAKMDARFDKVDNRLEKLENHADKTDNKIDRLDFKIDNLGEQIESVAIGMNKTDLKVSTLLKSPKINRLIRR